MSITAFISLGIVIGVACGIWTIRAFTKRKNQQPVASYDDYLDQTCELNYEPKQDQDTI